MSHTPLLFSFTVYYMELSGLLLFLQVQSYTSKTAQCSCMILEPVSLFLFSSATWVVSGYRLLRWHSEYGHWRTEGTLIKSAYLMPFGYPPCAIVLSSLIAWVIAPSLFDT